MSDPSKTLTVECLVLMPQPRALPSFSRAFSVSAAARKGQSFAHGLQPWRFPSP